MPVKSVISGSAINFITLGSSIDNIISIGSFKVCLLFKLDNIQFSSVCEFEILYYSVVIIRSIKIVKIVYS